VPDGRAPKLEVRAAREGAAPSALSLDRAALGSLPKGQVPDVGALVNGKKGRGVHLSAILSRLGAGARAQHVHIASSDAGFAVSVPIGEVLATAIVVYELDGAPLPADKGGPFRLLVPGHPDECVNVKQLARLEFADAPGPDTRPKNDAEHARLHERARKQH
jgi:DMSO/TMAO reductase YedYZ molybdopterin-dependent catalytic subunit